MVAPVNAPLVCPNISDSISSRGIEAQSTTMYGLPARPERSWMASATSSLPVPVSPSMMIEASLDATSLIRSRTAIIDGERAQRRPRDRSVK